MDLWFPFYVTLPSVKAESELTTAAVLLSPDHFSASDWSMNCNKGKCTLWEIPYVSCLFPSVLLNCFGLL